LKYEQKRRWLQFKDHLELKSLYCTTAWHKHGWSRA